MMLQIWWTAHKGVSLRASLDCLPKGEMHHEASWWHVARWTCQNHASDMLSQGLLGSSQGSRGRSPSGLSCLQKCFCLWQSWCIEVPPELLTKFATEPSTTLSSVCYGLSAQTLGQTITVTIGVSECMLFTRQCLPEILSTGIHTKVYKRVKS